MKKNIILIILAAVLCNIGCSNDQNNEAAPPQKINGAKVRIDSISLYPEDPATFKFNYNSDNKVKDYWFANGWDNIYGSDSIAFDYQPERITTRMSFLKDLQYGLKTKQKLTGRFYLKDGKIICASIPIGYIEQVRDSIIYHYDGDKLSSYEVYEVSGSQNGPTSSLCYVQTLKWQDDDLISMSAVKNSETLYETTFAYNTHAFTAFLPYMSFEYLLDTKRTYISVLANMGYFGVLPKHELTEIVIERLNIKTKYQVKIDYQYGADGLPLGYDFYYNQWYWGQPFFSGQESNEEWNLTNSQHTVGFKVVVLR